jgi:excisionase family DNA binding protein
MIIRKYDTECTQTSTRDGAVLLTPADAAELAKVSRDTSYREIECGELRALHVGRQLRIDPVDLNQYLGRTPWLRRAKNLGG